MPTLIDCCSSLLVYFALVTNTANSRREPFLLSHQNTPVSSASCRTPHFICQENESERRANARRRCDASLSNCVEAAEVKGGGRKRSQVAEFPLKPLRNGGKFQGNFCEFKPDNGGGFTPLSGVTRTPGQKQENDNKSGEGRQPTFGLSFLFGLEREDDH